MADHQTSASPSGPPKPAPEGLPHPEGGSHPFRSKVIRFGDLVGCGQEVWIEHKGQLYRLRETRHGKLLLSK